MLVRYLRTAAFGVASSLVMLAAGAHAALAPRYVFLQPYVKGASFELEQGTVSVWEPQSEAGPHVGPQGALVDFEGELDQESTDVLARLVKHREVAYLSLNSPGGLVAPTLRLGQLVRSKKVITLVEGGSECHSACALLFVAGSHRILGGFDRPELGMDKSRGVVGFHAPYVVEGSRKRHLQDVKSSASCNYLKTMLPRTAPELCDYMLATKGMVDFGNSLGRQMEVFTHDEPTLRAAALQRLDAGMTHGEHHFLECTRFWLQLRTKHAERANRDQWVNSEWWPCGGDDSLQPEMPRMAAARIMAIAYAMPPAGLPDEHMEEVLRRKARTLQAIGLTDNDRHHIACERAMAYLQLRAAEGGPQASAHSKTYGQNCFYRTWDSSLRFRPGKGKVEANAVAPARKYIARQAGAAWFDDTFPQLPLEQPLPPEWQ